MQIPDSPHDHRLLGENFWLPVAVAISLTVVRSTIEGLIGPFPTLLDLGLGLLAVVLVGAIVVSVARTPKSERCYRCLAQPFVIGLVATVMFGVAADQVVLWWKG